jgi:hypothetical protein
MVVPYKRAQERSILFEAFMISFNCSFPFSFNGARTSLADVTAGNGAVHSVDAVIMPKVTQNAEML